MKLTEAHLTMLREAQRLGQFYGFPAGSNLWPFTCYDKKGAAIDGEVIDELLRAGLLAAAAAPLKAGQRSPDTERVPNLDFEHVISVTDAGRRALQEQERAGAEE